MRKTDPADASEALNLDSLSDIVTNCVGMLLTLGIFVTLSGSGNGGSARMRIERPHATSKAPIFYVCQSNHLIEVDPTETYAAAIRGITAADNNLPTQPVDVDHRALLFKIQDRGLNERHFHRIRVQLLAKAGSASIGTPADDIAALTQARNPAESFFFFWVYPRCFETYGKLRKELRTKKFEVGFLPVDAANPPFLCPRWDEDDCAWNTM